MRGLTSRRFKLNRRMRDMKAIAQSTVDPCQNVSAFGHRHLGDRYVAGERMRLRAQAPDMQIVDVEHAVD